MRFVLERALFAPRSGQEALCLLHLLIAAAEDFQHHAVQTDPPYVPGADNQEIDTWLRGRNPEEAAALRTVLESGNLVARAARMAEVTDRAVPPWWHLAESFDLVVERRPASDWPNLRLTLADALKLSSEPLHLVLEHEWNDFAFVVHLAGPTDGPVIRGLKEDARLQVHGGGSMAKTWLQELLRSPGTDANWRRVLRTWVLFDQDSGDADAREPSTEAGRISQLCVEIQAAYGNRLSWACLRRREIESYVPDAGLQAIQAAKPDRAAMLQRILDWRRDPAFARHAWAFDFKRGLKGDLRANLPEATKQAVKQSGQVQATMLKPPFAALTPQEVADLQTGLGDKHLNEAFKAAPPWTARIPDEYDRGPFSQSPDTDPDQAPRVELIQALIDRI